MPYLSVMSAKEGHLTLDWDPDVPDDVERAKKAFVDLKAKGYRFWLMTEKGNQGKVIRSFKGEHGRLIFDVAEKDEATGEEKTTEVEPREKKREVVAANPVRGG